MTKLVNYCRWFKNLPLNIWCSVTCSVTQSRKYKEEEFSGRERRNGDFGSLIILLSSMQERGKHPLGVNYYLLFLHPFPAVPLATIRAMLEMAQSTTIQTSAGGQFDVSMLTDCTWWVSETGTTIIYIQTLLLVDRDFFPVEIMWFKWTTEVGSLWFSLTFLAKYPLSILSDVAMF